MLSHKIISCILIICAVTSIKCQRSPYAGNRPNGYKDRFENNTQNPQAQQTIVNRFDSDPNYVQRPPFNMNNVVVAEPNFATIGRPTSQQNNNNINSNTLDNRFGENNAAGGQAQSLPHEAYGDKDLVDRYNREPVNHRPFWLVNQAAIEAQKGGSGLQNQQTTNQVNNQQQQQANANRQNTVSVGNNLPVATTQSTNRRQNNNNVNNLNLPNVGQLSQRFGGDVVTQRINEQNRPIPVTNQGIFPNGGVTNPDRIQQFAQLNGPLFAVPNTPQYGYFGGFRRPNALWQDHAFLEQNPEFF